MPNKIVSARVPTRNLFSKTAKKQKSPPKKQPGLLDRFLADASVYEQPKTRIAKPKPCRNMGEWLNTTANYKRMTKLAKSLRGLSMQQDWEDVLSAITIALLEAKDAPLHDEEFDVWLQATAKKVAGGMRDVELRQAKATDTDALAALVVDDNVEDRDGPVVEYCSDLVKMERNMKARVARAIATLPEAQREAIRARYFTKSNLTKVANYGGFGNSTIRMRLSRGMAKLGEMLDCFGRRKKK